MSEREDVLQRLLSGELDPEAPEALAFLARHPDAAARLEAMRRIEAGLERAAGEREASVAEAERLAGAPGEDRVERILLDGAKHAVKASVLIPSICDC